MMFVNFHASKAFSPATDFSDIRRKTLQLTIGDKTIKVSPEQFIDMIYEVMKEII
jgi:hypothetical protein